MLASKTKYNRLSIVLLLTLAIVISALPFMEAGHQLLHAFPNPFHHHEEMVGLNKDRQQQFWDRHNQERQNNKYLSHTHTLSDHGPSPAHDNVKLQKNEASSNPNPVIPGLFFETRTFNDFTFQRTRFTYFANEASIHLSGLKPPSPPPWHY